MFTIKTLNAISPVGLAKLSKNLFDVSVDADAPDGILVRSADLLNTTFNDGLLAIARAGAGVNNIPLDRCSEQGIVVFNTPGANANAVAELVIGMLIAGSRNVPAAAQWTPGLAGDPAKDTINAQTLSLCKDGVKLLNYARGELVNTDALLEALDTGKVSGYMTDFPSEALLGRPGVICPPHLGASTPEAEDNCAVMAAQEISDYLKNGNITHSVNMPEVHQPRAGGKRICIIHKNEPGMISQITALTTEAGLNIENMVNKSKKNMAYTMLDATGAVDAALAARLSAIPAVIRVRIL